MSDVRQVLTSPAAPEIYVPFSADPPASAVLVARTSGDPAAMAANLPPLVAKMGPDVGLSDVWPMPAIVDSYFPAPFVAAFVLLSAIALVLSALGLYAVVAFQVTRRTREFGIRMALGADSPRVIRMIVGEGLRLTVVGLVLGATAGALLGRVLASRFADVRVADPALAGAVAVLLGVVSVAACLLPARRATRVGPAAALRCE